MSTRSFVEQLGRQEQEEQRPPTDTAAANNGGNSPIADKNGDLVFDGHTDENGAIKICGIPVSLDNQQQIISKLRKALESYGSSSEAQDATPTQWARQRTPESKEEPKAGPAQFQEVESHAQYIRDQRAEQSAIEESQDFKNTEMSKDPAKITELASNIITAGIEIKQALAMAQIIRQIQIRQQIELDKERATGKEPAREGSKSTTWVERVTSQGHGPKGLGETGSFVAMIGRESILAF